MEAVSAVTSNAVRVQVVLAKGQVHRCKVGSSASLDEIIAGHSEDVLGLLYMRTRIDKADFDRVTLASLGIMNGSASFRAELRTFEVNEVKKDFGDKLEVSEIPKDDVNEMEDTIDGSTTVKSDPVERIRNALKDMREKCFDDDSRQLLQVMMKIANNLIEQPFNEKVKQINVDNPAFHSKVGNYSFGRDMVESLGYKQEGKYYLLSESSSNSVIDCLKEMQLFGEALGMSSAAPRVTAPLVEFDPFKSNIVRVNPQPRGGTSAVEDELAHLEQKRADIIASAGVPCRDIQVVNSMEELIKGETSSHISSNEESDSWILLLATKTRIQKQKASESFRTKPMRDLESLKNARVFTRTLIRVVFPDKVVMQGTFSPLELVGQVKQMIVDLVGEAEFCLYTSPPRMELDHLKTLSDCGMVPGSLVYVSWIGKPVAMSSFVTGPRDMSFPSSTLMSNEKPNEQQRKRAQPRWLKR